MKKFFKKISKIFLFLMIILFLSIFVSSFFQYKKSDFNIPKNFFDTKLFNENPNSEKNGFNEFLKFVNNLEGKTGYFDVESTCIFGTKYSNGSISQKECESRRKEYLSKKGILISNDEIINKEYEKFRLFVLLNKFEYKKILKKDYIVYPSEYKSYRGKKINYTPLINYSRGIRYVAYKYFEKGNYKQGISILLDWQQFIDELVVKTDGDLINALVLITLEQNNLNAVKFLINKYNISNDIKNNIKEILLKHKIDKGFLINSIKFQHNMDKLVFDDLGNYYDNIKLIFSGGIQKLGINRLDLIQMLLFYSKEETKILYDKQIYDSINNDGKEGECNYNFNLSNYYGRNLICRVYIASYEGQFKKIIKLTSLKKSILKSLD